MQKNFGFFSEKKTLELVTIVECGFAPSGKEQRGLRCSIRVSAQHRAVKGESVGDSQIAQRTIFENTASRLESSNPAKTESWSAADHQCDVAQS
jgi:hypothetical protein